MMLRDVLQEETATAIAEIEKKRKEDIQKADQISPEEIMRANTICENLYNACSEQAKKGLNHAKIMELKYNDFNHQYIPPGLGYATVDNLIGAARRVAEYAAGQGLHVVVNSWHDSANMRFGRDLIVGWQSHER